jgi:hypothetical protein
MQRTAIQKARKPVARISAKRLALLGGKLPFSTVASKKRFIAPRKKRTTTPILSTPYPGALDPRSYVLGHRVKLYGADKEAMRERIFKRAGDRCEEKVIGRRFADGGKWMVRCPNPATQWSHNRHGSNKCDCLKCGIASCTDCHRRKHNTGKETPCPSPKS